MAVGIAAGGRTESADRALAGKDSPPLAGSVIPSGAITQQMHRHTPTIHNIGTLADGFMTCSFSNAEVK